MFPEKTKTLHNEGNLTIVQLLKEDQGNYECVASNVVASVITSSLLLIEGELFFLRFNVNCIELESARKIIVNIKHGSASGKHQITLRSGHSDKLRYIIFLKIISPFESSLKYSVINIGLTLHKECHSTTSFAFISTPASIHSILVIFIISKIFSNF